MAPKKKDRTALGQTFLAAWRKHRGLKQKEAGEILDLDPSMVSKIENAKSPYSQRQLEAWAKLYRCSPADLLGTDPTSLGSGEDARLRSALLAFGVDREDVGRAVSAVKVFVDDLDEQSPLDLVDDQSGTANPRHVKVP